MSTSLDGMTDRTRKVLRIAAAFSRQNGHSDIEPQDLLDALAHTYGISDHVLKEMGYQRKILPVMFADAEKADQVVCASETLPSMVAQARERSQSLGHDYVGTEHVLLALARMHPELTPDYQTLRARIVELLGCGL
ncbi:MAG: Clp protease N-terminal domain-containing protein [Pirellulales bacterium]